MISKRKIGFKRFKDIDERYRSYIDECKLNQKSKNILWEWINERRANKYRDVNNLGLLGTIINIGEAINSDLTKLSRDQLQKFFKDTEFKSSQELWYKKCLKRFYKWLAINKDDPRYLIVVNWIDTKKLSSKCSTQAHKKREDNLLSPEEVRKMISKAIHLRDKLAISLLADTGVRAETIGASKNNRSVNIGQLEFKKGYAIIKDIEEKFDKKRNVIVTEALSYLIKYWNEYPEDLKQNPRSPLFLSYSTNRYGERWGYAGLTNMLHRVSKGVLGRIINAHDFRHLKGTRLHLDDNLSDEAKCKLMGWTSRRMLDRYSHTTFDDARQEYLSKKGIIKLDGDKKKVEATILKPKECYICHNINSITDEICEKCGNTLDPTEALKSSERDKELLKLILNIMNKEQTLKSGAVKVLQEDPELKKKFEELVKGNL